MKTFMCIVLLAATTLAAPEGQRDKRGLISSGWDSDWADLSLGSPIISHSLISEPAIIHKPTIIHKPAVIHEPAVISVKKIVEVPKVISVKKIVSVPEVVSIPHLSSHLSYAPSISSGWW